MSLDEIIIITKNFYYIHTYLTLAIVAGLVLFLYFKPKAAFKTLGALLAFSLLFYSFSMLGNSASTGVSSKKQMSNQTLDKLE